MQEQIEQARIDFQRKMNALNENSAACQVEDERDETVTRFYLAIFEVFKAIPFFNRDTGEIQSYSYWVFFMPVHFENGMQYAHLFLMRNVHWFNDRNVEMVNEDGWKHLFCAIDPPEVDQVGNEVFDEWRAYLKANPKIEELAEFKRQEYWNIMQRMSK